MGWVFQRLCEAGKGSILSKIILIWTTEEKNDKKEGGQRGISSLGRLPVIIKGD